MSLVTAFCWRHARQAFRAVRACCAEVFLGRAQRALVWVISYPWKSLAGAREHGFEEDRRRAGEAEHLRVGALRKPTEGSNPSLSADSRDPTAHGNSAAFHTTLLSCRAVMVLSNGLTNREDFVADIQAFDGLARNYDRFRPGYPPRLLSTLASYVRESHDQSTNLIVDVGAGTGISTRAIAASLDSHFRFLGVEPNAAMRKMAAAHCPHRRRKRLSRPWERPECERASGH
jgi:hypothetical protein